MSAFGVSRSLVTVVGFALLCCVDASPRPARAEPPAGQASSGASEAPAERAPTASRAGVSTMPFELWRDGALVQGFERAKPAIEAAEAGDTILVAAGVYFEPLSFQGKRGTAGRPITFAARPGARPVFDGAYPPLARAPNTLWQPEPEVGPGVFSAEIAPAQRTAVYLASGARLYAYLDRADFRLRPEPGAFVDVEGKRIYLRLEGGVDPRTVAVFAAAGEGSRRDDKALLVRESAHVAVRGIELRHGGLGTVRVIDSTDVLFEDVVVRGGAQGLSVDGTSERVTVSRCRVQGDHDPTWFWRDQKRNVHMESNGIVFRAGAQNVVEYTEISGWFNGVNAKNSRPVDSAERNRGLVLRYNWIHDIVDDGIELDGYLPAGRIYENRVEDVFSGVSMSPRFSPRPEDALLFYRNVVAATKTVRFDRGERREATPKVFKLGGGRDPLREDRNFGPEGARLYHNTFFGTHDIVRAGFGSRPAVFPRDFQWWNNVFYTKNGPTFRGTGVASDGVRLDGNLYYQERQGAMFAAWNAPGGRFRDLAQAVASRTGREAGWEAHGLQAEPGFVDANAAAPRLSLRKQSAARDGGAKLPAALTDSVVAMGPPDRGAFEYADTLEIERLVPDRGPRTGGGRVFVRGRYLDEETAITLGGRPLQDTKLISSNVLVGTLPEAPAKGAVPLVGTKGPHRIEREAAYTYE